MTTKIQTEIKDSDINPEKVGKILEKLIDTFNEQTLSNKEIVLILSNLGYSLGAFIEGYKGTGPSLEKLEQQYHENPTTGGSLMLQSLLMSTWVDQIKEKK